MTVLRRLAYAALGFAFVHIVFGAIVRITGSGLGCGDHWPKCHGEWFPPLERIDLVIEITHRWLAAGLTATILALFATAFLRRRAAGVGGPGGVLRSAALAVALVLAAAIFGAIVVKLELTNPHMIVVHLGIAMTLLAVLVVAVMRAGGLGAATIADGDASARSWRGARIAAGLAIAAVLLGALTANVPGANGACVGFPHCREIASRGEALHLHVTHRVIAFLLLFHALALALGIRRRGEGTVVRRAAWALLAAVVTQILVAAVLVELRLPAIWRSLHMAVGTAVWVLAFHLAMLARRGSRGVVAASGGTDLSRPVAAATAAAMLVGGASRPSEQVESGAATTATAAVVESVQVVDMAAVERSTVELVPVDVAEPDEPREPALEGSVLVDVAEPAPRAEAETAAEPVTVAEPEIVAARAIVTEPAPVAEPIAAAEPVAPPEPVTVAAEAPAAPVEDAPIEKPLAGLEPLVTAEAVKPEPLAPVATEPAPPPAAIEIAPEPASAFEIFPVDPDEHEDEETLATPDDEAEELELDANAAALAELDRLTISASAERREPDEAELSRETSRGPNAEALSLATSREPHADTLALESSREPDADTLALESSREPNAEAPPLAMSREPQSKRLPPTLAVIIARGADF